MPFAEVKYILKSNLTVFQCHTDVENEFFCDVITLVYD